MRADERSQAAVGVAPARWRPPRPGRPNWRGLWTQFFGRGLLRFLRAGYETLGAPAVSSLLFLAVFGIVAPLDGRGGGEGALTTLQFVAPGVVIFSLAHSAFEFAAFMMLYDKMERMIEDVLAAPLSPLEMLAGHVLAATLAGCGVGLLVCLLALLFVPLELHSLPAVLGFGFGAALLFALLGTLVGLWADRWDHYAAAESFLVLPLVLLSGAFFGLSELPEESRWLLSLNPLFHTVDGFRYGLTGAAQSAPAIGALFLAGTALALWLLLWRLLFTGYKLRS